MRDKVLSLLGIAQKARAVVAGNFLVEQAVSKGTAMMVILAEDAAPNTTDGIRKITHHYGVPVFLYGTKGTLGHAIGKNERSCAAVLDDGFAKAIRTAIESAGGKELEN